ncbi:unnamed protein product [Ilex paraguariensis]|uniref:Structure-specific endonuclease subunit SLX1 homolog n=1 Tax=Ilex paraguariensis TaxID=185542 RepID=A0ABC8SLI5_9AQUA
MGRRKRTEIPETQIHGGVDRDAERERESEVGTEKEKGGKFFACYLLTSLSPRHQGHTYIGFTVNPRRRIRQHNGEMRSGAWRTKSKRPWEMVLCIYGFPTNVAALQLEWAWQHPVESLAVRKAAATFKSLSGLANKIKLAYTMLTLPSWQSLKLTINFFSTKYQKHTSGCPSLPEHMKVQICSMDELPCYTGGDWNACEKDEWDDDEECDETGGFQRSTTEGSVHPTNHNSADTFNGIEESTCQPIGWMEESGDEQTRGIEEFGARLPRDSSSRMKELRQPFCLNKSPVRALLSSEHITIEIEDTFRLIEEHGFEMKPPAAKHLTTKIAAEKSQHLIKSYIASSEVEIIDVFTPSPANKIISSSKKRRFSTFCPEIIDLTKSPIFV